MSRLPRPYIPISVRCKVASRQLNCGILSEDEGVSASKAMAILLARLREHFGCEELHLDHDPALCNRQLRFKLNKRTGKNIAIYTPDANDPRFLVYRPKVDHEIKTRVRGEHGQYSDLTLMKRERRRLRKEKPRRAWPTGRKMQSRGFRR